MDYNSSLPIRSESDGTDERVHVKIVDKDNPDTQQATVDTDSNVKVGAYGDDPGGVDRALRTSEQGHASVDGEYDATNNTDPSNSGLIAHQRNAALDDTHQTERITSVTDSGGTVKALDIALHDEDGEPYSASNPMPVTFEQSEGAEVHDFDEGVDIASDATSNHDYVVADGDTFLLRKIHAAASGKMKIELQIGDGAVSEVFSPKMVNFNSTANPECNFELPVPIVVIGTANGTTVRLIRTNLDNQAQSLYSQIQGVTN